MKRNVINISSGLPWWLNTKESACNTGDEGAVSGLERSSGEGNDNSNCQKNAQVFVPGKSHGQRSLAGYSPWGRKESGGTQRLNHHHELIKSFIAKSGVIVSDI